MDLEGGDLNRAGKILGVEKALLKLDECVAVHVFANRDNVSELISELDRLPLGLRRRILVGENKKNNSLADMVDELELGNIDMGLSSEDTGKIGRRSIRSGRIDGTIGSLCVQSFNTGNKFGHSLFLDAGFDVGKGKSISERAKKMIEDAIMASCYVEKMQGVTKARVGLLTNGKEKHKGDDLIKEVRKMLEELDFIEYVGYIEGDSATHGMFDILLTDGHTGNIALKLVEGQLNQMGGEISNMIKKNGIRGLLAGLLLKKDLEGIKNKRDPNKYPLAIFLGYLNLLGKIHGGAKVEGYTNGIIQADGYIRAEHNHGLIDVKQERLEFFRKSIR